MSIDPLVVKKLQSLEEVHIPYAVATNMPFVTCDEETYNDQVWIFSTLNDMQEFASKFADQKILFKDVRLKKEHMPEFYADLHSMGINEIVFCDENAQHKLEFSKLVKINDFSKMPENQRPLFNQELQLSTIYFLQEIRRAGVEPDKEKLEPLAEEMYANVAKSKFLLPAMMEETEDKKGRLLFPYLTDKKGNKFQPIFSDHTQYTKHIRQHKPEKNSRVLLADIEKLQKYLLPHVQGYMLNPDSYCHVLTMQQLKFISKRFGK